MNRGAGIPPAVNCNTRYDIKTCWWKALVSVICSPTAKGSVQAGVCAAVKSTVKLFEIIKNARFRYSSRELKRQKPFPRGCGGVGTGIECCRSRTRTRVSVARGRARNGARNLRPTLTKWSASTHSLRYPPRNEPVLELYDENFRPQSAGDTRMKLNGRFLT